MFSAVGNPSSSNSLNNAQKDSVETEQNVLLMRRTTSFNQSTSTFSGETNPPSATYATSSLPMSAHAVVDGDDDDSCDSKEPLFVSSNKNSSFSLLRYPTGPASNRHWGIPRGLGLRGGAGETSVNNGAGSWTHPPASGGWGSTNTSNQGQGQWGAASSAASNRSSAASQGPPGAPPPGSSGQQASNQQQQPTSGQQQQQGAWDTQKNVQTNSGSSMTGSGATAPQSVWTTQVLKAEERCFKSLILLLTCFPCLLSRCPGS